MMSAFSAALSHRLVVLALAIAATARLLAAVMHSVNGCPRAPLSFSLRNSALLVTFFDVSGLSFLIVGVFVFVASWHFVSSHFDCISNENQVSVNCRRRYAVNPNQRP
jgi:hypothetical protein